MLLAGELLWDIDSATWVGAHGDDNYAWGAINGYWSALKNAEARQSVTIPENGNITIWGNLKRNTCGVCGGGSPGGEYETIVSMSYNGASITWTGGEDGYKEASGDSPAGARDFVITLYYAGINAPCYGCGSDTDGYGDVYDFGLAYTADIPAAPDPCEGTDIGGGLDYDAEG
jgi:hypothetical protein